MNTSWHAVSKHCRFVRVSRLKNINTAFPAHDAVRLMRLMACPIWAF